MSKPSLVRAASLWCIALCLSACIFSESSVERDPRAPDDGLDMSASDQGGGLDLDAPDLPINDQGSDLDTPDQDMSDMDMACMPASDEQLCGRAGRQCGALAAQDCGETRAVQCGSCQQGECMEDGTCSVCQPETDVQLCARSGAACGALEATDNCGNTRAVSCGDCMGANERCTRSNQCVCESETEEQLCGAAGRQCGELEVMDRCGRPRRLDCGICQQGQCLTDGTCSVCQAESNAAFCARLGATCGQKTAPDNCGNIRTVSSCGACGPDEACDVDQCVCQDAVCSPNAECGSVSNACGDTTQCGGGCDPGEVCNGQNRCVCPPAPACPQGAQCGFTSNACGNMRACGPNNGACAPGLSCANGQCVNMCTPESDAQFCQRTGATCGQKSGTDNCGQPRTASCGACQQPQVCNNSNVCACQAESNAAFCQRLGATCGSKTGTDNCGNTRTVNSCGSCQPNFSCNLQNNTCVCNAESDNAFCQRLGAQCGLKSGTDLCGNMRTADCGQCAGGSARCSNNMCSTDTPDMGGDMGDMGCSETDAQICQRLNIMCGQRGGITDICGKPRCVDCGDPCGLNAYCCGNACIPSAQLCNIGPVLCGVTE